MFNAVLRNSLLGALLAGLSALGAEALAQSLIIHDRTVEPERRLLLEIADLDALAQGAFATQTPWTSKRETFSGPTGAALAKIARKTFDVVRVRALNDYEFDVPRDDFVNDALILATRRDGALMSIRQKGPFWIMYDFDAGDAIQVESWRPRSVWQIASFTFIRR